MTFDLDSLIDRRRLSRRLTFWRVVAVLAFGFLAVVLLGRSGMGLQPYVARVTVEGMILENPRMEQMLREIAEDSNARALIVRINSPGGSTAGSEALYHALRNVAAEKPVVAVMGTLAASGGYVTAIAADRIFARETTLTGSIGVIVEYAQIGELLDKIGIRMETIKSAPLKGEPSLTKPLSPEAREAIQSLIDDGYDWFVGLVADRRGMDVDAVRKLADGRVFSGRQAVENGLVDGLGGEREAREWLEAEHDVDADLPVVDFDPSPRDLLLEQLLGGAVRNILSRPGVALDGLVSVWHPEG